MLTAVRSTLARTTAPLRHLAGLCLLLLCAAPVAHAQNTMAINMSGVSDFNGPIYADLLKQNRTWNRPDGSTASINAFGFPTETANSYLTGSMPLRAGTYRVYHNGAFTLSVPRGSLSAFTTDAATGLQVATWVLTQRESNVLLTVANVTTAPTVFSIMRPIAEFSATSHARSEMVDRQMVASWGPTQVVRYMDPLEINGNSSALWVNRTRPTQHPLRENPAGGAGMPIEHVIRISNDTNTSPWICLPHMADDDYITKVAQTFRYGSDGINPFTSDAAREAARAAGTSIWEPLAAHLSVYTEYSNEVWNSNAAFGQTPWVQAAAVDEATTNPGSMLLYDGITSATGSFSRIVMARYYVRRAVFISEAFRAAFGDAAMMSRVRPLLFWQQTNANSHGSYRMAFLNDFYGQVRPGNSVARTPDYFFWGAGAATYYSPGADSSVTTGGWDGVKDTVWNSGDFNAQAWTPRLVTDGGLARGNGLHYVAYEGGPGLGDPLGGLGTVHPYASEIINDPRVGDEMFEHHRLFNQYGGDLFNYFTHQGGVNSVRWGFALNIDDPLMPKMTAYHALASDPVIPEIYGTILPTTFPAANFTVNGRRSQSARAPANTGTLTLENGSFAIYDVRTTTPGNYQVVVTATSASSTIKLAVTVDGQLLGLVNPATTGSTPLIFAAPANRRLGVKIAALGGSTTLSEVAVTAASTAPVTAINLPVAGTTFSRAQTVFATGNGDNLVWQASGAVTATGTGSNFTFTVPANAANGSTVTLQLTGSNGTDTRTYSVINLVPTITTSTLPNATAGTAYNALLAASNADSTLTWSLSSGSLPPGISFSPSGTLVGAPLAAGTYSATFRVDDANGDFDTRSLTLSVAAATDTFNSVDDKVVLEAEHALFATPTEWEIGSAADAVGGAFIQETTGANQSGSAPSVTTADRFGTYRFNVTTAGNYRLYVRMRVPVTGNSVFYRLNGGEWVSFNDLGGGTNWSWVTDSSKLHPLSAGTNLMEIVAREPNTQLDRFVFQLSGTAAPTGNGPAENPQNPAVTPPTAPTGLSAVSASGGIDLTWNSVASATSYSVKRATTSAGPFLLRASGLATPSYSDTGLNANETWFYVVAANNAGGSSSNSTVASATVGAIDPNATAILSPAAGTTFVPLQSVTLTGSGLGLNWSVSGAATAAGAGNSLTFVIPAAAANNTTITATLTGTAGTATRTWTILDAQPSITTTTLPDGLVGAAYPATTLTATGGNTPLTWNLTTGTLPAGLTLSSTGSLTGTPSAAGTFNVTVAATDADGDTATQALTLVIASAQAPTVITSPDATTTFKPLQTLTLTGTGSNLTWNITGAASATGVGNSLTFTIPAAAANNSSLTATLTGAGGTATRTWTIVDLQPTVATATLPGGTVGTAYPATTLAATSGDAPLTWSLATGTLPAGLSLTTNGTLSGTPTSAGTASFTVAVTDADGDTATRALSITVQAATQTVTLLGWDFTNALDKSTAGSPSTTNVAAVQPASIIAGPGVLYNTGTSQNTDAYPVTRANSTALDVDDYLGWNVTLAGTSTVSLTRTVFGVFHGDTGLTSLRAELRFSTDGFATFTSIPLNTASIASSNLNVGTGTTMDVNLSSYPALQNLTTGTVSFRVYFWGMSTQFRVLGLGKIAPSGNGFGLRVEGIVASSQASQTLTFPNPGSKTYGDAPFALAATASSGLPVTYTVLSGPVSLTGNIVTITGAGTAVIRASQPGDSSYLAAQPVDVSLSIAKAPAGIVFGNLAQTYDGSPKAATVTTSPAGLAFSLTYDGATSAPVNAGSYAVVATLTDANYSGSTSANLMITQAGQTITFPLPGAKTYGDAPFALAATASSGLPVTYTVLSGPVSLTGNIVTITGAGTAVIRASQPGNASYSSATPVHVTLSIAKTPAGIALGNLAQTYDGSPKAVTVTTSPAGLAYSLTYDGATSAPVNAGSYTVIATLTDANYSGSASANLVIAQAGQTITFPAPASQTYGAAPFALTATASSGLPVTYTVVSGPVSLADNIATITGAGTAVIRASQPGNASYSAAAPVDVSIAIAKATATITLTDLAQTYDGSPKAATVTTSPAGLAFSLTYDGATSAPVNAGSYAVVATLTDANYSGSASANLVIAQAGQTITFPLPGAKTYGDAPFALTATASSGLPVTYTVVSGPVSLADNIATITGAGTAVIRASQPGNTSYSAATPVDISIAIAKATATITLTNLAQTYDGSPKAVTVTTSPAGLAFSLTYDGATSAPVNAGSYAIVATLTDANYSGSASANLVIAQAGQTITFPAPASQTYGAAPFALTATASSGLPVTYTVVSGPVSLADNIATITGAGTAVIRASQPGNANYPAAQPVDASIAIAKATATITLTNLVHNYDGEPKSATITTDPESLTYTVTYDGGSNTPKVPGDHAVIVTINDANYQGTATATLRITITALVRHAPTLNGMLDGSVQVLLPESITLNGSSSISGDILTPGLPTVKLNGKPLYVGTLDGIGNATPQNHQITLNGGTVLRHVVRRTDAIDLPVLSAAPIPTGTRSLALNAAGQPIGDFSTLLNLTVNSNVGTVAIQPGSYGTFTVNSGNTLVLGDASSAEPVHYYLQTLTLNGNAKLHLAGPVVLTLVNGLTLNASATTVSGEATLLLRISVGGLTLNGNTRLQADVIAPAGTISLNGTSTLTGRVVADRLTLNGNTLIEDPVAE